VRIRQVTNKVAIQLVNVRTLKIVKLLTFKAEDLVARDYADMNAFAVQYITVDDRPPIKVPEPEPNVRSLGSDSEANRALALFPLRLRPWQRARQPDLEDVSPLVHTRRFALEQRCNRGGAFASRPHRSEQPVFFRCPRRPRNSHFSAFTFLERIRRNSRAFVLTDPT
jgi:hypothetical protein